MNAFGRLVVGLLLVVFDLHLRSQQGQFDLRPDVLGWLAASAARRLARLRRAFAVARIGAIVGMMWSVLVLVVLVGHTPTAFMAGLVDIVLLTAGTFCVCTGLVAASSDPRTVRSADALRWVDLRPPSSACLWRSSPPSSTRVAYRSASTRLV